MTDYLYNIPNNSSGLDRIIIDLLSEAPFITPLLLLFVYFVVMLGGASRQKLFSGWADYSMWSLVASMSVFMIAMIMSITAGFIKLDWLVIVIVLNIFSAVWFFLERKAGRI